MAAGGTAAIDASFVPVKYFILAARRLTDTLEAHPTHTISVFVASAAGFTWVTDGSTAVDTCLFAIHFAIGAGREDRLLAFPSAIDLFGADESSCTFESSHAAITRTGTGSRLAARAIVG